MNATIVLELLAVLLLVTVLTPPLGHWMAKVLVGEIPWFLRFLRPLEKLTYRLLKTSETVSMSWGEYFRSLIWLHVIGILVFFIILTFQNLLPFNPDHLPRVPWDLALNTAVSFATNTNWQAYSGESTLGQVSQLLGCTVQNFLSAAVGLVVLIAFIRGLLSFQSHHIGNLWVDLTRALLYILLPLSVVLSLLFVSQGVIQNFNPSVQLKTLEGKGQRIVQGPVASQIAIKQLGTNGGGYFNANSAHPFENPTPLTNLLSLLALILIPSALTYSFGVIAKNRRQGWVIWSVMMFVLMVGVGISLWSEIQGASRLGVESLMEGKETRFGVLNSILWSTFTSAASNGSVNAMLSSMSPLAGGVALFNILLGEVVFGGVGSGLYGMFLFVIMTVFLCGLMVGRTPEYCGKKIESREIQWSLVGLLGPNLLILLGAGFALSWSQTLKSLSHQGPHGLTEMLYAFASTVGNNGSAFAGLTANTTELNLIFSFMMFSGRFLVILSVLAVAGNLAAKKQIPPSEGTFKTDSPLFAILLLATLIIFGGLTFFPTLALGPVLEHLAWMQGRAF